MDNYLLQKSKLTEFLTSLGDVNLIAPVAANGTTRFELIENAAKAKLDLEDYTASPKKVVFPQTETLFAFRNKGDSLDIEEGEEIAPTVVFGIRPCDAKSFVVLDPLFNKDFEDPYYKKRRDATVLIGQACAEPTNRCFCPSLGGSPGGTEGLDILMTDIGNDYFLEVLSEKGKKLMNGSAGVCAAAAAADNAKKEKALEQSLGKIKRQVDLKQMHEMLPKTFEDKMWKEVGNSCIGCGICTYNCPTCHCFDIQDEGSTYQGRRLRVWDACMYPEFTVHASGENPRHDRSTRIRNRIMHKFTFYPNNLGHISCVGCGRCIELCPVNEDLIEILNKVRAINE